MQNHRGRSIDIPIMGGMMIYKTIASLAILVLVATAGCDNLSPRDNFSPQLDQRLERIEGDQNELENLLNSIKVELGSLRQSLDLQNSNNNEIQQGWLNVQADGILISIFAIVIIGMLLYYMYRTKHFQDAAEMMAEQIRNDLDYETKERIMAAAWNTHVEKTVYKLIS